MSCTHETIDCPNHDGAYDCTPFCRVCEGNQGYCPTCDPMTSPKFIEDNGHLYHCDTEMKWFDHEHPEGGDCYSVECIVCGLILLDCEDYK